MSDETDSTSLGQKGRDGDGASCLSSFQESLFEQRISFSYNFFSPNLLERRISVLQFFYLFYLFQSIVLKGLSALPT